MRSCEDFNSPRARGPPSPLLFFLLWLLNFYQPLGIGSKHTPWEQERGSERKFPVSPDVSKMLILMTITAF